jgi:hypothetical protein
VEDGDVATALEEVMRIRDVSSGLERPPASAVTITGVDPVFSTRFKIAETCAAVLGGVGVAVSDIWELKTGRAQAVTIDVRHAAAGLRSSVYLQRPGSDGVFKAVVNKHHEAMIALTQPWRTKDGTLGPTAFRSAQSASSNAEVARLRTQSQVRGERSCQMGCARSRGSDR